MSGSASASRLVASSSPARLLRSLATLGCSVPKLASSMARARRMSGSASASRLVAQSSAARLLRSIATSGCSVPKLASSISRARRDSFSASRCRALALSNTASSPISRAVGAAILALSASHATASACGASGSRRGQERTSGGSPVNAALIHPSVSVSRCRLFSSPRLRRVTSCTSRCTANPGCSPCRIAIVTRVASDHATRSSSASGQSAASAAGTGTSSRNNGTGSGARKARRSSNTRADGESCATEVCHVTAMARG